MTQKKLVKVQKLKKVRNKKVIKFISAQKAARPTALKVGDTVMVIAGGSEKRKNKGKIGKILKFVGVKKDRVIVDGVNISRKHKKRANPQDRSGIVDINSPIHISNVMYYVEKLAKPTKLKYSILKDGKKVRGYINPEDKKFVAI